MFTSQALKKTYNKIAADWDRDHSTDTWWIAGTSAFLDRCSSGGAILDVGCGAGEKSKYMVERGFTVHGIDLSERMVELAQRKVPSGQFWVKDILQPLGLRPNYVGVLAQAVLLHVPKKDIEIVLKHITEPLVKGGHLYLAVKERRANQPEEEVKVEQDYGYTYERFFSYFTKAELEQQLERAGLVPVYSQIEPTGKTNWIQLVAQKQ